jgi:hypothetical protein
VSTFTVESSSVEGAAHAPMAIMLSIVNTDANGKVEDRRKR